MSADDEDVMILEEQLLASARSGDASKTREILEESSNNPVDINVRGSQKFNSGWTPLHLACYFGHHSVAELLLKYGADVNIVNNTGDTALHKAAYTGREEIVHLLLANGANVFVKNGEGKTARDISKEVEIVKLLKAAEETDVRKKSDLLLHAAREGDMDSIKKLLQEYHPPDINCVDSLGNTSLHCAAYRGKNEAAILLLQNGIDPAIKNRTGQLAIDLAINPQMKQILCVKPMKQLQKSASRFEGSLLRKSRFLGWKEVWVVLEKGVMSTFLTRADASTGTHRKGYHYLDAAEVLLDDNDESTFLIKFSSNRRQRYCVPVVTHQQVDRQKWINAINEHIEFSAHYLKQELVESDTEDDVAMPLGTMQDKLQTAQALQQLLEKQVGVVKPLCENLIDHIPNSTMSSHSDGTSVNSLPIQLDKLVNLSHKMSSSLSHCLNVFAQQEELRQLQCKQQQEQIRVWQDALHALAQEHHELEKSLVTSFRSPTASPVFPETDYDEFFDAFEGDYSPPEKPVIHNSSNKQNLNSNQSVEDDTTLFASFASLSSATLSPTNSANNPAHSKWGRSVLPAPMFTRNDFSVWSILKHCIGRELSKITMPVIFNEPLSLIQRFTESIEYCNLLVQANACDDPVRRMEYVATFAITSTSSNWDRLGKPFNPLLGETYELSREDMGFRIVCEQVSHHPPVSAFHADSEHYTFSGTLHPKLKLKLWTRSVDIKPEGIMTVKLLRHNEVYTWSGVDTCIHNIIVGKLWMEQCGTMQVKCHTNGLYANLTYKTADWFGRDLNQVEGFVYDKEMNKLRFLFGKWTSYVRSASVDCYEDYLAVRQLKSSAETTSSSHNTKNNNLYVSLERSDSMDSSLGIQSISSELLWEADIRPEYSVDYFNFTLFAMSLNELTEGMNGNLPPTDSRLRPDIRKLEEGDIDGAAAEKNRLEEKQRSARAKRRKDHSEWVPLWFTPQHHPYMPENTWVYKGGYWDRNFGSCPDIF